MPFRIYLLSLCNGLGLSTAVIMVTVAPLAGAVITPNVHLATLAFGLQFVVMIPASFVSSSLMQSYGRKTIFIIAGVCGISAGIVGAWSIMATSLFLLCCAHMLAGIFLSNVQLLRFAAIDMVDENLHKRVITLVLLGGVFAAILGPTLARNAEYIVPLVGYAAVYSMVSLLSLVVLVLIAGISLTKPEKKNKTQVPTTMVIRKPGFLFAVYCGGIAYFLMNLLMIASSLFLKKRGFDFHSVSIYIQFHVLAMYLPSLFSSWIIEKTGIWRFLFIGIVLQIGSNIVATIGGSDSIYLLSLILLGISWNFMFTSGTYIQGRLFTGNEKFKAQGLNDMSIAFLTAISALFAASFLITFGWNMLNVSSIVICILLLGYSVRMRKIITNL